MCLPWPQASAYPLYANGPAHSSFNGRVALHSRIHSGAETGRSITCCYVFGYRCRYSYRRCHIWATFVAANADVNLEMLVTALAVMCAYVFLTSGSRPTPNFPWLLGFDIQAAAHRLERVRASTQYWKSTASSIIMVSQMMVSPCL